MAEQATEFPVLNPYHLKEGDKCDTIRITCNYIPYGQTEAVVWDGAVAMPEEVNINMADAAETAFMYAKQQGGLQAAMMAYCTFSYRDDAAGEWYIFDPA